MDNTRNVFIHLKLINAGICVLITWFLGDWDISLNILIIFMIVDYITGVIVAVINNKINSSIGFKGIFKKILIILVLIVAALMDRLLNNGVWAFRTLVCYFYISNEGISILENIGKCGVDLPKGLKRALEQLREKGDDNNENYD